MGEEMRAFLFTDGASRGNPGPAGAGIVLKDAEGNVLAEKSQFLGRMTNNESEYRALLLGLMTAQTSLDPDDALVVLMDSQLVVSQLKGEFKIKAAHLKEFLSQAKSAEGSFASVVYKLIPREKNSRADALANQALNHAG